MKVYIQFDFEGVAGFVIRDDQDRNIPSVLERSKRFMKIATAEVSAAVRGAIAAGATEVVVWDSHGNGNTVLVEELPEEAQLITGDYARASWLPFFDNTDIGIYIGGHAMDGTPMAVTPHTLMELNGVAYGEVGMFILECGAMDVPVVLVSGDSAVKKEIEYLIPNSEIVVTKYALGPTLAKTLTPQRSCRLIEDATKRAVSNRSRIKPVKIQGPYNFKLADGKNVTSDEKNLLDAYRKFLKNHYGYDKGWPEYNLNL
jgi:D-amino peptidase